MQAVTQVGSTVGSTNGTVNIVAGKDANITASNIIGQQGINLTGQNININVANNTSTTDQTSGFHQSGLTVSVGSPTITALTTAVNDVKQSQNTNDPRLKALLDLEAAKAAKVAMPALQGIAKNGVKAVDQGLQVTVSLGSSGQKSETITQTTQAQGSNLTSSGDINITATGSGATDANGKAIDGNLNVIGSIINGQNVTLSAAKDVNLQSAENTSQNSSTFNSSSSAIGANFSIGNKVGAGVFISGSKRTTMAMKILLLIPIRWSQLKNTLTVSSGNNTNLTGAQANGNTVVMNVGGNLNLASQQDIDNYTDKNNSSSFNLGTNMTSTASASKGKTDSAYTSVTQQTGIFAGQGGFSINVGGNTDLKGAVIASTATPV